MDTFRSSKKLSINLLTSAGLWTLYSIWQFDFLCADELGGKELFLWVSGQGEEEGVEERGGEGKVGEEGSLCGGGVN